MRRVCPQCQEWFTKHFLCPRCGVALLDKLPETSQVAGSTQSGEQRRQKSQSRLLGGLVVTQGLAYGSTMIARALAQSQQVPPDWWEGSAGQAVLYTLQGISLLIGGLIISAGQKRGPVLGIIFALLNVAALMGLRAALKEPLPEPPIIGLTAGGAVVIGLIAGLIGSRIWSPMQPLPESLLTASTSSMVAPTGLVMALPEVPKVEEPKTPFGTRLAQATLGIVIITASVYFADDLRQLLPKSIARNQSIQHLTTWSFAAIGSFLGGCVAGYKVKKGGLMNGIVAGVLGAMVVIGLNLSRGPEGLHAALFLMSLVGDLREIATIQTYQVASLFATCGFSCSFGSAFSSALGNAPAEVKRQRISAE
jgi:putative membrane protein (TIGR04086 family)